MAAVLLVAVTCLVGCASNDFSNASFSLTESDAKAALDGMHESPKPLKRPVLVLGGFSDPGFSAPLLAGDLRRACGEDVQFIPVSFLFCWTFDDCRDRVIEAVDRAVPTQDPNRTAEVDVVGISMGGLVARYAAAPSETGLFNRRRLRVARLFTISSPHRGARAAVLPTFNQLQLDMRVGSPFFQHLEAKESLMCDAARDAGKKVEGDLPYPVYPYVRLHDTMVGVENAAPNGRTPIWVANLPLQDAHFFAPSDPRILADISRRLRGEAPYAHEPAEPPPDVNATVAAAGN